MSCNRWKSARLNEECDVFNCSGPEVWVSCKQWFALEVDENVLLVNYAVAVCKVWVAAMDMASMSIWRSAVDVRYDARL